MPRARFSRSGFGDEIKHVPAWPCESPRTRMNVTHPCDRAQRGWNYSCATNRRLKKKKTFKKLNEANIKVLCVWNQEQRELYENKKSITRKVRVTIRSRMPWHGCDSPVCGRRLCPSSPAHGLGPWPLLAVIAKTFWRLSAGEPGLAPLGRAGWHCAVQLLPGSCSKNKAVSVGRIFIAAWVILMCFLRHGTFTLSEQQFYVICTRALYGFSKWF